VVSRSLPVTGISLLPVVADLPAQYFRKYSNGLGQS